MDRNARTALMRHKPQQEINTTTMTDYDKHRAEEQLQNSISVSSIEYEASNACFSAFKSEFTAAMADVQDEEEREYLYSRMSDIRTEIFKLLNI